MNRLLGLLLAVNAGVLVFGLAAQYWPQQAQAPMVFNAEKIRVLGIAPNKVPAIVTTRPEVSNAKNTASEELAEATESTQVASSQTSNQTSNDASAESRLRCLSWRSLDIDALNAIQAQLKRSGIPAEAYDITLDKKLGWWVFIPPVQDQTDLENQIDEVRSLGVTDFATVRSGVMRNAISLGVFANLGQASRHAAELRKKGISVVKFGPRPESGIARLVISSQIPESALPDAKTVWPKGLQPAACAQP